MTAKRTRRTALEVAVKRAAAAAGAADSWQAALALTIARDIEAAPSLGAKVSAGKLLAETMAQLGSVAAEQPAEQEGDALDELDARRQKRIAAR